MTTLLVAATGGHLSQLYRLRPRFEALGADVRWITFDTPQSRSLLRDEPVEFVRYTASRDAAAVVANLPRARRLLRARDVRRIVSTGSAVALSFLPLARSLGIEAHYVESAARGDGPSVTGRLLRRVPGVQLYTQHPTWASPAWRYRGSIFDAWESAPPAEPREVRRLVVSLGTIRYGFRRLLERLIEIVPPGVEVIWQTGETDVAGLPIAARASLPSSELDAAVRAADVVVAHSGIGSAISALEAGRCPVLVPRLRSHGEHVDDHQRQIADVLAGRGLAVTSSPEALTWEAVCLASVLRARPGAPEPFRLG